MSSFLCSWPSESLLTLCLASAESFGLCSYGSLSLAIGIHPEDSLGLDFFYHFPPNLTIELNGNTN